jgi:hypothetical protein
MLKDEIKKKTFKKLSKWKSSNQKNSDHIWMENKMRMKLYKKINLKNYLK